MHEVTSQHPNSPNIPRADDERSPLLPKCAVSCVQQYGTDDDLSTHTLGDAVSTAKLRWIMTSVWIGTFCAGLGTPWSFLARVGEPSENKTVNAANLIQTQVLLPHSDRQLLPNLTLYRFSRGSRLRIS